MIAQLSGGLSNYIISGGNSLLPTYIGNRKQCLHIEDDCADCACGGIYLPKFAWFLKLR